MEDDIRLEPNVEKHEEEEEKINTVDAKGDPASEISFSEPGQVAHTSAEEYASDDKIIPDRNMDDSHGMDNVVAAIDAFLADPLAGTGSQEKVTEKDHDEEQIEAHAHVDAPAKEPVDELAGGSAKEEPVAESDVESSAGPLKEPPENTVNAPAHELAEEHGDEPSAVEVAEDHTQEAAEQDELNSQVDEDEAEVKGDDETKEEEEKEEQREANEILGESHDQEHEEELPQEPAESHERDTTEAEEDEVLDQARADPFDDSVVDHQETSALEQHGPDASLAESEHVTEKQEHETAQHQDEGHDDLHDDVASRRSSSSSAGSQRRTSLRTEALIQAAARAVVATIEKEDGTKTDTLDFLRDAAEPHHDQQHDLSEDDSHRTLTDDEGHDGLGDGLDEDDDVFSDRSPRSSLGSFEHHSSNSGDDEQQDETDKKTKTITRAQQVAASETGSVRHRSPRLSTMSGVSAVSRGTTSRLSDVTGISSMSQYERHDHGHGHDDDYDDYDDADDFVPHTIRGTPRPAFRTPSAVRAIQMSSPSPSVIFGASPRSSRRHRQETPGSADAEDDGEDMGMNAYTRNSLNSLPGSPSKKSTPTRFKKIFQPQPAPLVLLHATLMPTRWVWSDVLRGLDEILCSENSPPSGKGLLTNGTAAPEPSAALKRLHSAWCQLQEYALGGDTVAERGVLLPHPQNDYEVLEERLLEALELPVRRRARILECGHYLGPADDDEDEEDYDDAYGDDYGEEGEESKRHWCATCRSDIRYESLGAERVFRVKVYASNGLMTAGAWEACWREMERVDVEIEPIVSDAALLRELNHLRTLQQEALRQRREQEEADEKRKREESNQVALADEPLEDELEDEMEVEELTRRQVPLVDNFNLPPSSSAVRALPSSPPLHDSPVEPPAITTTDQGHAEQRRREAEERLREIYGRTPPQTMASETVATGTARDIGSPVLDSTNASTRSHDHTHAFGPSPPSPSAEAYERREERRQRQQSSAPPHSHFPQDAPSFSSSSSQPTAPYESASLSELLLAATKVVLRDRKHVVITVLSALVVLLVAWRSPAANVSETAAAVRPITEPPLPMADQLHAPGDKQGVSERWMETTVPEVAATTGVPVSSSALEEIVRRATADAKEGAEQSVSAAGAETQVETIVEKKTVKVYETVTETQTETAIATATTTATATAATPSAETVGMQSVESVASSVAEPKSAVEVASADKDAEPNTANDATTAAPSESVSETASSPESSSSSTVVASSATTETAKPTEPSSATTAAETSEKRDEFLRCFLSCNGYHEHEDADDDA